MQFYIDYLKNPNRKMNLQPELLEVKDIKDLITSLANAFALVERNGFRVQAVGVHPYECVELRKYSSNVFDPVYFPNSPYVGMWWGAQVFELPEIPAGQIIICSEQVGNIPICVSMLHVNLPKPPKIDPKATRKAAGLCIECGDAGEWRHMALFCRNKHGIICG